MRRGALSDLFDGVVAKRLTLVETITPKSNQHEFQGIKPLRDLFGLEDRKGMAARFIFMTDEQDAIPADGFVSWSNVRKGKPRSAEYHLYYPGNAVTEAMQEGDTLFIALRADGSVLVVVAPQGSTILSQLMWLFGLDQQPEFAFQFRPIENTAGSLDFASRYILDELGIDPDEPESDGFDGLLANYGLVFPTTREFSLLARNSLPEIDPLADADAALIAWMEREELLFRRLERRIVAQRIEAGFVADDGADVDGFLSFSLSVQNRRKSRAGLALENHLGAIFDASDLRYQHGVMTENGNKPDFLFPSQADYQDAAFPVSRLTMLGAKSTLKDRWRQVLSEAVRIPGKHLATLEPSLSTNQTDEMVAKNLQLVVPAGLHATYQAGQRSWLMTVADFIALVRQRQI